MEIEILLKEPTLDGQFPIMFRNGFQVSTLGFWCPVCNRIAPLERVYGHISRLIENVADVTAAMKCPRGKVTSYRIRLKDDNTYSYLSNDTWIYKTIEDPLKKGIKNRFLAKIYVWLLKWESTRLARTAKKMMVELEQLRKLK